MPRLVAIDLPGGPRFVEALQAAWDRGDAALPLDQRLAPAAKAGLLDRLRPAVVVGPDGSSRLADPVPVEPGDALVVATSGTTGEPRGVVLTTAAVAASADATSRRLGVDPAGHRWLACLPLSHVGGLSVVTRALLTGVACTVLPGFELDGVLAASGPDVFVSLVPTALGRVGAEHFHTVVLGGSAPPSARPANVVTTYGMTETGSGVVYDGLPLDGVSVRVDDQGVDGPGGEIRLRGPMLLRAYRDGTPGVDADGWFRTGDAGSIDERGRLRVLGRLSELIVTGGDNVWPAALEAILARHPGVAEVAVSGRPDPEWGQRVVAWVVPRRAADPPSLDALKGLVRDELAAFAAPKELVLVESLPKTAIGKVRRDALAPGVETR